MEIEEVLRFAVADHQAPAYSRNAAARFIVDAAFRARELDELETSILELDHRLGPGDGECSIER